MSQTMPSENLSSRVLMVLGMPLMERIHELTILFDSCNGRQLQTVYPHIVHSIFGINGNPIGWGLRTTTQENSPHYFHILQQFFGVRGPWMHMCHKILNDATKFELDVNLLPRKFVSMLQAGQNPMFYADLINIDTFRHQVVSLSLNAFDFFIFHFVLYALNPLHSINPIAMQIHNGRIKTFYHELVEEYLNNFLTAYPDNIIEPVTLCGPVKTVQPLPAQSLQPQRQPRYLKIPSSYRNGGGSSNGGGIGAGNTSPQSSSGATSRAYTWRSESVLHFFVDIWLRYDVESEHHLPSSDFVRSVRTLCKQIHFFANASAHDHTSLNSLRKVSLGMVRSRIYAFLCGLIDRWPLDSSLTVVLELWLSYIQPWRYTLMAANNQIGGRSYEPPITNLFDGFIIENLIVYTHIFMQLLPRFERLDYTVYRNAQMLLRLAKTFNQPELVERLQRFERLHSGNAYGFDSPQRQVNIMNKSNSFNAQWNPMCSSNIPKLFSESMKMQIEAFLFVISMARNSVLSNICLLRKEISERQRSEGFLKNFLNKLLGESTQDELMLRELSRIPEMLRQSIDAFCRSFGINPSNLSMHETLPVEQPRSPPPLESPKKFSFFDSSDSLDTSKLTPHQMSLNASNFEQVVDPALLPIQNNELKPLVRLLHMISEKMNQKYGIQFQTYYLRNDYFGKLTRRLLYAPMTEQWFDKQCGNVEICKKELPPRLCLRPLASIQMFFLVGFAMLVGQYFCGSSLIGFICLCLILVVSNLLLALIS
ncbi:uncharacterized protein Dwil_GK14473 [Drosophila willistoni]|uniref:Uncharacterized protein n=1 Tax=Drosophila willistoni TaxID=7260 RepID=B4NK57_DROWI|nr:sphingomyelin phosphodiesterase 4 [Drosophila willistoni]EDW85099.1 uncharacterized protein Dwil_GK14473 [Drosophila willistoni]